MNDKPEFRFADDVVNPDLWIFTAQQLLASADILEPEITPKWHQHLDHMFKGGPEPIKNGLDVANLQMVYLMLVSYAIENLLKSAIVKERKEDMHEAAVKTGKLPKVLLSHALLKLAKDAHSKIYKKHEEILRRLTLHSVWAGRYPIPTTLERQNPKETFTDGKSRWIAYWTSKDIDIVKELIQDLCLELNVLLPK